MRLAARESTTLPASWRLLGVEDRPIGGISRGIVAVDGVVGGRRRVGGQQGFGRAAKTIARKRHGESRALSACDAV
jgi:hypothetical protein